MSDPDDIHPANALRIVAVAFDPAEIEALPAHVRLPGSQIIPHGIDSFRDLTWSDGDAPDVVVSPLVTLFFDAQDLASLLVEKGFSGRYIAIARNVAGPQVIRADVARVAPFLQFDVVLLDGPPALRAV